ncbi:hypothetical protein Taro_052799 [Colocasia esculenta]|uniref:Secreted protein n=1 Tax=Colocasia esculenta TaxID=4460 RepID=A0A843XKB6_COLES|nr:hypothetical protein [Colocasia esculenta]
MLAGCLFFSVVEGAVGVVAEVGGDVPEQDALIKLGLDAPAKFLAVALLLERPLALASTEMLVPSGILCAVGLTQGRSPVCQNLSHTSFTVKKLMAFLVVDGCKSLRQKVNRLCCTMELDHLGLLGDREAEMLFSTMLTAMYSFRCFSRRKHQSDSTKMKMA